MKRLKHILLSIFALVFLFGESFAQSPYLADFSAYVDGEEIYVSWTTKKGFTCENIEVQLGTDTMALETVHVYLGVCGGDLKEEHYFYRIPNPIFNATNFIRLDLGLYGFSGIVDVKPHKALQGNVLVFPQPGSDNSKILFHNPQSAEATFKVYNTSGTLVSELTGVRKNQILMGDLNLDLGIYYLHLFIDDRSQVVRIVKSH